MKQILGELIKKWWTDPLPTVRQRDVDLIRYFDPKVRKILSVIGFRRVGKTFTLLDFAHKFGKEKCIYINFEDERLAKKTEVLSTLVDLVTELKGVEPLVFLFVELPACQYYKLTGDVGASDDRRRSVSLPRGTYDLDSDRGQFDPAPGRDYCSIGKRMTGITV
jgi:hypothetical protein